MEAKYVNKTENYDEWIEAVLHGLSLQHPNAASELDFNNPYELLVATILSAQCTDKQVNRCTPALFEAYPTAYKMAEALPKDVEPYISSCGFYHNKAANIVAACKDIVEKFNGNVPDRREALESLAGVGRKTAGVVLANAFGIPAIAVDTHVFRVSNRIGITMAQTPEAVEKQLMAAIPQAKWAEAHHWIIFHGRRVCKARNPQCKECGIRELCQYYISAKANTEPR